MRTIILLLGLSLLSACGTLSSVTSAVSSPFRGGGGLRGAQNEVDGLRFRTRVRATSEDRRAFSSTTRGAARGPLAAAEAGRVEAVEYCIRQFGGSEIAWVTDPDAQPSQIVLDASGALVLRGACLTR